MNFQHIKEDTDLLALAQQDTTLQQVATTGGGEWAGPCPFCVTAGKNEDRFRVQPNHPNKPRWFCRGCGDNKWHDVIDYLQRSGRWEGAETWTPKVRPAPQEPIEPPPVTDYNLWRAQGQKFVDECQEILWSPQGEDMRAYLHNRGLTDATIGRWRLGLNPGPFSRIYLRAEWGLSDLKKTGLGIAPGLIIPGGRDDLPYIKIRQLFGQNSKYTQVEGSDNNWLFGVETFPGNFDAFIFEGELDVMLAYQESEGLGVAFGSLPAKKNIPPGCLAHLTTIQRFLLAHDMDDAGRASNQKMKEKLGHRAKELTFPAGNDLTDFYLQGGNVFEWLYAALQE